MGLWKNQIAPAATGGATSGDLVPGADYGDGDYTHDYDGGCTYYCDYTYATNHNTDYD